MAEKEMELGDALNELQKMKRVFQAVQKLEEVLVAVNRLAGRKAELEREVANAGEVKVKSQEVIRKMEQELQEKESVFKVAKQRWDAKFQETKEKLDHDVAELNRQFSATTVAAKARVSEDVKREQQKVDVLIERRSDLQRDIRVLEAELAGLEERKKAVQ